MSEQNPQAGNVVNYDSTPPAKTGLAITSMVLGIVGVATGCFVIGVPIGLVGLILGIVALVRINGNPREFGGKGFAIAGIATGAAAMVVVGPMLIILMPSIGMSRELANRGACSANIRGILSSCLVYSAENSDQFPVVLPPVKAYTYKLSTDGVGGNVGGKATTSDDAIKSYYSTTAGGPYDAGSVTANLWILVLRGQVAPKSFICKSDPFAAAPSSLTDGAAYYINFNSATAGKADQTNSYSFAYPWITGPEDPYSMSGTPGKKPKMVSYVSNIWRNTTDSSLPLMSDMAPLNGTGSSPVVSTPGTGVGGLPTGGTKAWSSPNHGREGQNVGFADVHVDYFKRPDVGQSSDNIFTTWGGSTNYNIGKAQSAGMVSGLEAATAPPYDIMMVPQVDMATGVRK